jgi:hypothetical protein
MEKILMFTLVFNTGLAELRFGDANLCLKMPKNANHPFYQKSN